MGHSFSERLADDERPPLEDQLITAIALTDDETIARLGAKLLHHELTDHEVEQLHEAVHDEYERLTRGRSISMSDRQTLKVVRKELRVRAEATEAEE